jgi:hypothetical protein
LEFKRDFDFQRVRAAPAPKNRGFANIARAQVQQDGGDWSPHPRGAFFAAGCRAKSVALCPTAGRPQTCVGLRPDRSRPGCMADLGRSEIFWLLHLSITSPDLITADNDFVNQYFKVLLKLIIHKFPRLRNIV